jgi:hypothetical protein
MPTLDPAARTAAAKKAAATRRANRAAGVDKRRCDAASRGGRMIIVWD